MGIFQSSVEIWFSESQNSQFFMGTNLPSYLIGLLKQSFFLQFSQSLTICPKLSKSSFDYTMLSFSRHFNFLSSYQNFEFQLPKTNGSGVTEKGCGSTFEFCHAFLSCITNNQFWQALKILSFLVTLTFFQAPRILNFNNLRPTVLELQTKGMKALLNYATPIWVA